MQEYLQHMNKLLIIASTFIFWSLGHSAVAEQSCLDGADTQLAMNKCYGNTLSNAKQELESILVRIRVDYKTNKVFLKKLNIAQKLWNESLSADMDLKFPAENKQQRYGSVYPMCAAQYKAKLIKARINYLQAWIFGVEEGEICSGSIAAPQVLHDMPSTSEQ